MSLFTSVKHTVSRELLLFNKCLIIKNNLRQKKTTERVLLVLPSPSKENGCTR